MANILEATKLSKGCIYGHFRNKEEIMVAAFSYLMHLLFKDQEKVIQNPSLSMVEKLYLIIRFYENNLMKSSLNGNNPLIKSANERMSRIPALDAMVKTTYEEWEIKLSDIIKLGSNNGEFKTDIDSNYFAGLFISILEGASLLTAVHKNPRYLDFAVNEVKQIIISRLINA